MQQSLITKYKLVVLFFLTFVSFHGYSTDYYWIGNSGNWNNGDNWSMSSGGSPSGSIPGAMDNVYFDENSFSGFGQMVYFNSDVQVAGFYFSANYFPIVKGGVNDLKIGGDFILSSPVHIDIEGNLKFNYSGKTTHTIQTFNNDIFANIQINGGKWNLNGQLKTDVFHNIYFNGGVFNANGFSIFSHDIIANTSSVKLNLESSVVYAENSLDLGKAVKSGSDDVSFWASDISIVDKGDFSGAVFKDAFKDCSAPAAPLDLDLVITTDYNGSDISCYDSCDANIQIIPTGTPGPFAYSYAGGPFISADTLIGLCTGSITVVVRDSSNELVPGSGLYATCVISDFITEPDQVGLSFIGAIDPTCPDVCDGQAFTTPFGGTGTLVVFWPGSGETTPNPTGLCVGDNTVNVVDDNGCAFDTTFVIMDPPPLVAPAVITPPTCNGDCDATIDVTPGGGNGGPYSFTWTPVPAVSGAGSNPAIGFCSGTINLTLADVDGCTFDTSYVIVDPPILNVSVINIGNASCFGVCDGTAEANPSGGVGPYTYEWFDDATGLTTGITDQIPNALCAGDYFVIVTDATGCTVQSAVITITEPTLLDAVAQAYDVSCPGVCDGSVDVDPTGGTLPYTFNWSTVPGGIGVGATDSLSGLCPGQFEIVVTDNNGCTVGPILVEVFEPAPLTLSIAGTDISCYDLCDGAATATVGGGTAPYGYTWTPAPGAGVGTPSVSGLCAGIYDLLVTDNNGCTITDNIEIFAPPTYDVTSVITNLSCSGGADGAIDLTINDGGSGSGYTFVWAPVPPVGDGTANVSGLSAGVWTVTIADDQGCDTTMSFTLTSPAPVSASASVISQVTCNGDCDGSAQVTILGGTAPYSILWDDPSASTSSVVAGLCAGTYNVTVTDVNGCVGTDNVTITEPPAFDITVGQTDLVCFGDCDATASVTVNSGGTAPYTFLWDDPLAQTTPTAIGLCAGTYTCTVTDANLCDTVLTFTIIEPTELVVTITGSNSSCFASCSGSADISISGGTPVYTIEWFDAATLTPMGVNNDTITGLCPGDYFAEVTDANGCVTTTPNVTITELPEILLSVVSTTDEVCGVCDGTAEIAASGGAGGFTFDWTPDPLGGDGSAIATGLCGGVYNVVVTDASGCTDNISVTINSVAVEVLDLDSVDVSCFGLCDGEISASFVPIDPPYTIEWFDASTGLSLGVFGSPITGLCAGDYTAVLTNNSGCVTSQTITVNEPPAITGSLVVTNVDCSGDCDGTITATAAGGTGVLTYFWSPLPGSGQGTPTAGGLCAGNWTVTITDENGCFIDLTGTVSEPTPVVINSETSTNVSCFGVNDGTATIIASGGIAPLSYEWFDCATGLPIGQTTPNATGLPAGSYQVVVTDFNGCTVTSSCLTVNEPLAISAVFNFDFINCFGECNGMIDVIASGGTAPYFYQWLDEFGAPIAGQTNDTLNNLCQGVYNLEISDINGCTQTFGPLDMTSPTSPWDVTVSQSDITCSGSCDGTATVTVLAGNNPPYSYSWDDPFAQVTPTATNLCAGTYSVTISDATVCDTTISFTIIDANPIIANAAITDVLCFGDCTGEITANPTGGTGPYSISFSDGTIGATASGLCAGTITLSITDATGCTKDTVITINEAPEIIVNSSFSNNATCGLCNGSATVNVTGGVGPYSYDWTPDPTAGEGTNNATGLCSGVTTVLITDANGCAVTEAFAISDVSAEVLTVTSNDASCFGVCDGDAEVFYTCSDPTCIQEWYDAGTGLTTGVTTSAITGLCAGDYFVEVINNSGCVSFETVTIASPTEILGNEVVTNIVCNGDATGSIELFPTGGSGAGYTYSWSPIPPNGDGTSQALNLTAGTYDVTVTDGSGCSQLFSFTLTDPPAIVITPTVTDLSCFGTCNGIVSVAVSGGAGGFTFQWFNSGVLMPGETSSVVAGLCAGNYNVEVTDANGCVVSMPTDVTVSEPVALTTTTSVVDVTCFGLCNGSVSVSVSGGTGPYTIVWFDDATGSPIGVTGTSASGLCAGDYYAVITDANGCNFTTAVLTISEPSELISNLITTDASCFGFCDGDAALNLSGGVAPYTYEWLDISGTPIPGGTLPSVVNLCEGNYTIEGTDANGCSVGPIPFAINGFTEITGTVFTNDATCGVADGSATINPSGGNPPYSYQWFDNAMTALPGETNNVIIGITSGIYFVEVTDANGCTQTFMGTVSDLPSTTLTFDAINHPSCAGGSDGSIDITATGVNLPLSYTWNPGGIIAEDPTGLSAGDYILEITDALGCINYYDTTLVDPTPINIAATSLPSNCGLCDGSISTTVTGGTGLLNVVWNTGDVTNDISSLCSGIYEITITDANGCIESETIEVLNAGGLIADALVTSISCAGSCDGGVTVTPSGGIAPYSIVWLHDGSTSFTLSGLCSGSYYATITDSVGCIYAIEVELPDPNPINAVETISNPACGASDGIISIASSGGVLPHSYAWSTTDVTSTVSGLAAGIYTLTITDNAGCSETFTYGLSNSDAPVMTLTSTNVSCFNACDGTGDTLAVLGTNPPYAFNWFDEFGVATGTVTPAITGLCEGDYLLEITDALGCVSYDGITIEQPDTILLNPLVALDPTCSGTCDGSLIANPIGGTPTYSFVWDDPAAQTTAGAVGLCDGTYNVTITDANGCSVSQTGTVVEPLSISVTLDSIIDATCINSTDGEIYISVAGGTPGYTYEWISQTLADTLIVEDATGLAPMNYYITVTDINGCSMTDTFGVDTMLVVLANAGLDSILCFGDSLLIEGFSNILSGANYTWYDSTGTIVSDTSVLDFGNLNSGFTNFILEVDYLGCTHQDTVSFLMGDSLWVNAGPDVDIYPDQSESIGGAPTADPAYAVTWTPSTFMDDSTLFNPTITDVLLSEWYYAVVTDSLGCSEIDSMYVTLLPNLEIPDGISPDGNGLNDTWILDFLDQYPGVSVKINVYNRWGELLFESDENYGDDWGGTTADGKKLPAGTYYYVIDIDHEDFPEPFTGPITIMW